MVDLLKEHKIKQEDIKRKKNKKGARYKDDNLVFCTSTGHFISFWNLDKEFKKIVNSIGIYDVSMHSLRHTFTTRGIEMGINIKDLQELLGHEDATILLKRYAHSMTKKESIERYKKYFKNI